MEEQKVGKFSVCIRQPGLYTYVVAYTACNPQIDQLPMQMVSWLSW